MTTVIEERRRARRGIEVAERRIEDAEKMLAEKRKRFGGRDGAPAPMEVPDGAPDEQSITLNIAWVGDAIDDARSGGFRQCMEIVQPLLDYANAHGRGDGKDWREAFDLSVSDAGLRELLVTMLDRF